MAARFRPIVARAQRVAGPFVSNTQRRATEQAVAEFVARPTTR